MIVLKCVSTVPLMCGECIGHFLEAISKPTECVFSKKASVLTSCREYLSDWGHVTCWDAQLWPLGSSLPGRGSACREVPPPGRGALMAWACSLQPPSSLLSAISLRPTEHPGKEPACPLIEKGRGLCLFGPHEWMGARLAKCMQCARSASIPQVPAGGRHCPGIGWGCPWPWTARTGVSAG